MDEISYNYYKKAAIFSSPEEMLSQEQIDQFSDKIVYYTDEEDGATYPVAINITDTAFAQDCLKTNGNVYIAFCGNTGRTERNSEFFTYLLNWK